MTRKIAAMRLCTASKGGISPPLRSLRRKMEYPLGHCYRADQDADFSFHSMIHQRAVDRLLIRVEVNLSTAFWTTVALA